MDFEWNNPDYADAQHKLMNLVLTYPDKSWNFYDLSCNCNISVQDILEHSTAFPWNWEMVLKNHTLKPEHVPIVMENAMKQYNERRINSKLPCVNPGKAQVLKSQQMIGKILSNPGITADTILVHPTPYLQNIHAYLVQPSKDMTMSERKHFGDMLSINPTVQNHHIMNTNHIKVQWSTFWLEWNPNLTLEVWDKSILSTTNRYNYFKHCLFSRDEILSWIQENVFEENSSHSHKRVRLEPILQLIVQNNHMEQNDIEYIFDELTLLSNSMVGLPEIHKISKHKQEYIEKLGDNHNITLDWIQDYYQMSELELIQSPIMQNIEYFTHHTSSTHQEARRIYDLNINSNDGHHLKTKYDLMNEYHISLERIDEIYRRTLLSYIDIDSQTGTYIFKDILAASSHFEWDSLQEDMNTHRYDWNIFSLLENSSIGVKQIFDNISQVNEWYQRATGMDHILSDANLTENNQSEVEEMEGRRSPFYCLSKNHNMDYSVILQYPHYSWNFKQISQNQGKYLTNQRLKSKSRTESRTDTLREELLAVTWYPDRMMDWCMDVEQKEYIRSVFR